MLTVVLYVEGGVVHDVEVPEGARVVVIDTDIEGVELDNPHLARVHGRGGEEPYEAHVAVWLPPSLEAMGAAVEAWEAPGHELADAVNDLDAIVYEAETVEGVIFVNR